MSASLPAAPGEPTADRDQLCVRVSGRVQGVGYRAFVRATAESLGITGWVCNRPDGSVEAAGQGAPAAIRALADALRRGPTGARVTSVESLPAAGLERATGFEVRRSDHT